jgi:signal peptidase I
MSNFLKARRIRRHAGEMIRMARHARNMREDVAEPTALITMGAAREKLSHALRGRDVGEIERLTDAIETSVGSVMPARKFPIVREYVEIVAVALAVAMGCRAYFIQPFKIPTGSMQPTLWGIHYRACEEPTFLDSFPTRALSVRRILLGSKYEEVVATEGGCVFLSHPRNAVNGVFVANTEVVVARPDGRQDRYFAEEGMSCRVEHEQVIDANTVIASGRKMHGDHVFVDKVSWNFRRPRRSEVSVFMTTGIERMHPDKWNIHYIKRLVGRPGEKLEVDPPYIWINDGRVDDLAIGAISRSEDGHDTGYLIPDGQSGSLISPESPSYTIGESEYFMCGDNTDASYDSRYWGGVPEQNLVGPAWVVYWPFGHHWGRIKR